MWLVRGLKRLTTAVPPVALVGALAGALLASCAGPANRATTQTTAPAPEAASELRANPHLASRVPEPRAVQPREADKVIVVKALRELRLLADGRVFRTYDVSLGREPKGDKMWEGDGRTPEGRYTLDFKNENSSYYRSIRVSYPNAEDWREARALGVHPGSDIMIHGLKPEFADVGKAHLREDWTEGCIAVTNREMDEIWSLVPVGTPIEIRP